MKRFLSVVLMTVLLSMSMITTVFADGTEVSVGSTSAKTGDVIKLDVTVKGNTGFTGYGIYLEYDDSALELQEITKGAVSDGLFMVNLEKAYANFANAVAIEEDGVLFTATFKVIAANSGDYKVGVNIAKMGLSSADKIASGSAGTVAVTAPHVCSAKNVDEVPATCEVDGVKAHQACACGKLYVDGVEVSKADLVIKAKGHTWGAWITEKDATEKETGLKYRECSVCFAKEEQVIPVLGHTHSTSGDWKYDADYHWKDCTCGNPEKEAHKFEWIVDKKATATEDGEKHQECSVCGYKAAGVKIPATGAELDDVPQTGSAVSPALVAVFAVALAGAAVILVQRKRSSAR